MVNSNTKFYVAYQMYKDCIKNSKDPRSSREENIDIKQEKCLIWLITLVV